MVAINQKRIHCVVIAVPLESEAWVSRGALAHEMVPGADPYVAQLIAKLQDEVRQERGVELLQRQPRLAAGSMRPRFEPHQLRSDLEIPWFDMPLDEEPMDESVPDFGGDANEDFGPGW